MRIEDKYSEELLAYIKDWASDSWETGHPMDCDDVDEFQGILSDDGFNVSFEDAKELFNLYFEEYDLCRERNNNDTY